MATISSGGAFAVLLTALAGGVDKPDANWVEVGIVMPASQHPYHLLNQSGHLSSNHTDSNAQAGSAGKTDGKISPVDFFRIVEIAPKAINSPAALKEPPTGANTLLRIKTSNGTNYYFIGEQEHFEDVHAQEIWTILRKYQSSTQ